MTLPLVSNENGSFSSIPSDAAELDRTLPVRQPYWLRNRGAPALKVGRAGVRATWIGHATVLAEVDGTVVITDPIFIQRASAVQWMGPKRYRPPGKLIDIYLFFFYIISRFLSTACTIAELPPELRAVVISHNHYDHLDYNSVNDLHAKYGSDLHWFVPKDMGSWFTGNFGIQSANVHELVWWEREVVPGTNTSIVLTPSNHWGRRGPFDENKALWGSYAIIGPQNRYERVKQSIN